MSHGGDDDNGLVYRPPAAGRSRPSKLFQAGFTQRIFQKFHCRNARPGLTLLPLDRPRLNSDGGGGQVMHCSACRQDANSDDGDEDAEMDVKIEFSERAKGTNAQSFSELLVDGVFRDCERSQVIKIGLAEGISVK